MSARRTGETACGLINALRSGLADASSAPPENNWATIGISRPTRSRRRTHSLFLVRGACCFTNLLCRNMTDFLLLPLIVRFAQMLAAQPLFAQMFGAI